MPSSRARAAARSRSPASPLTISPPTAPQPKPSGRFADVPTVHAEPAPRPPPAGRFADAKTVVPQQLTGQPYSNADEPTAEQTQMLQAGDLVELTPGPAMPPAAPAPAPHQMVSLPAIGEVYPGHPYYGQNTVPSGPRNWPPWVLGVMFVIVLAVATGITVAIARAVS